MAHLQFNDTEQETLRGLVERFSLHRQERGRDNPRPLLHEEEYLRTFSGEERALLERFLTVDPKDYDVVAEPITGANSVPEDLMRITGQYYRKTPDAKRTTLMGPRYLPRPAWAAFEQMRREVENVLRRPILVTSGYRTPRHQLLLFVQQYLAESGDVAAALRRVGLPGYSQHGDPVHTASDLLTLDGVYDESFAETPEYAWLAKHAGEYGFTESFPRKNGMGMDYEPWHWRYTG